MMLRGDLESLKKIRVGHHHQDYLNNTYTYELFSITYGNIDGQNWSITTINRAIVAMERRRGETPLPQDGAEGRAISPGCQVVAASLPHPSRQIWRWGGCSSSRRATKPPPRPLPPDGAEGKALLGCRRLPSQRGGHRGHHWATGSPPLDRISGGGARNLAEMEAIASCLLMGIAAFVPRPTVVVHHIGARTGQLDGNPY
uniref:Uncharacterized protein n=1 Tax=Oryza punctata TaxID=4537 RepID=A0A0E0LBS2_ORYPU